MPVPGSTVNSINRNRACPSPSFDARNLKNAKWSSTEDINHQRDNGGGSFRDLPQTWTPRNLPSPSPDRKDFRAIGFDSSSLKRNTKRSASSDGSLGPDKSLPAGDSFAWKDNGLDKDLRAIKDKKFSDAPEPKNGRDKKNDGLEKDLARWANTPLPKPEDPDVILLKKARQEKKVKRYLEDNFQNRQGHFTPEPDPDNDIGSLQSKYSLDRRREDEQEKESSPPKSPPPFSKAESRFEREQRIKVGSLDSYTPGNTLPRQKSISPPPAQSGAQQTYERERFRVEPGRIENYTIGRGTLAQQESYKAGLTKSTGGGIEGCGITKYSGSHSFNPLLMSKSSQNLSIKKSSSSDGKHLQRTLKDGYESDSTLSYRRHNYTPSQSANKSLYTQVQKGGEVPQQGLRMQAPEKKDYSRPSSAASGGWRGQEASETEEELKRRQKRQLDMFYKSIDQTKETQLRVDLESRKHHDTLLPSQKSPLPHNRYEEDSNGNSTIFLNAGKKPADCKMVAKALFSFQAQNSRELSFRKGEVIYIKKQVDNNWYEGERNASVGIFPVTYVEILPNNPEVSTLSKKEKSNDGQAKARFNFTAQTPMELSLIKGEMITLTRRIDKNWYEGRIGSRKGILPVAYVDILSDPGSGDGGTNSGLSTLLPKPAAAPAAHSILKNGAVAASSYVPVYEKQKPVLGPGSASPYSTLSRDLSRPGSSMSNGKPEPTPFRALYNYKPMNDDEVELCEGDVVYVMEKCDDGWFVGTSQRTGIFGTFPGNYVTQV